MKTHKGRRLCVRLISEAAENNRMRVARVHFDPAVELWGAGARVNCEQPMQTKVRNGIKEAVGNLYIELSRGGGWSLICGWLDEKCESVLVRYFGGGLVNLPYF